MLNEDRENQRLERFATVPVLHPSATTVDLQATTIRMLTRSLALGCNTWMTERSC